MAMELWFFIRGTEPVSEGTGLHARNLAHHTAMSVEPTDDTWSRVSGL
jgi:hypothetical protein